MRCTAIGRSASHARSSGSWIHCLHPVWTSSSSLVANCLMLPSAISSVTSAQPGGGAWRGSSRRMPDKAVSADESTGPSAAQRFVLRAIRGYQVVFAPMYAGSCRYLPSCSMYASEAVERHGVGRGGWLALRRLMRCHPFGGHGLDPVPAAAPRKRPRAQPLDSGSNSY